MKTMTALLLSALLLLLPSAATAQIIDDARSKQAIQHYRSGQDLMFAEQFEKAADQFRLAIDRDPLLTLAHYGLGQSYMAQKRYASAIQAYVGCREAYRNIHTLQQRNAVSLDRRADDEIRELKDTISALRSGRIKSLSATVDARVAAIENRIRDLERLRQQDTGTFRTPAEVSLALGSAYFRNGGVADAEREWQAAVSVNSRLGEAHNNLAVVYMMSGRQREAEDAIRLAERSGFRVNPQLKADVQQMRSR